MTMLPQLIFFCASIVCVHGHFRDPPDLIRELEQMSSKFNAEVTASGQIGITKSGTAGHAPLLHNAAETLNDPIVPAIVPLPAIDSLKAASEIELDQEPDKKFKPPKGVYIAAIAFGAAHALTGMLALLFEFDLLYGVLLETAEFEDQKPLEGVRAFLRGPKRNGRGNAPNVRAWGARQLALSIPYS